jgi:hypothetical protein
MNRTSLHARIARFIDRCADGHRDDVQRDALLAELSTQQAEQVEPYRRYLASELRRPQAFGLPALPTDVFRFARVASHSPHLDVRSFRTSGTTAQARGEHAFADLSLYDRAARTAASYALFPETARIRLCILAPSEHEVPDSSLSYMLARFKDWFGTEHSTYVWRDGKLRTPMLIDTLRAVEARREPIALLGTSFAFVHADDELGAQHFHLPRGSRIMQTGGFKGRSRSVEPDAMLELLSERFGVDPSCIVQEYGMTELSSQLYETPLRAALLDGTEEERTLWVPGWMRAVPIDPLTLEPVEGDALGLLRIDDLANVGSVCSLQTSDLACRAGDGIVLHGRAPGAVARGCSLAVEEWLGGSAHGAV